MENHLTYELAFEELQQIATAIENETITVDQLAEKVKRAATLIAFCQSRLRSTETEVNKIINQLDKEI
ncbi:exodeoxyribonuclease VII small subunit [Flavihumibacter profundi]|uniref:exodeoxyribonuclease VII small subunit n=1 Tax=Flavihumibacter profundi TaxID=2716883 RepID=UPI001CC3CC22|nr:exodeoxyribonuclease VII small subunit [Flavihumibacter profundi]MBZ5857512.1 exodeoxyribonuclease VII small subunit [Flavihumibacter profundi]